MKNLGVVNVKVGSALWMQNGLLASILTIYFLTFTYKSMNNLDKHQLLLKTVYD